MKNGDLQMHMIENFTTKILTVLLLILVYAAVNGQNNNEIEVETHIYEDTLGFDIYLPTTGGEALRPVLIYVHGGGFSGGKRDSQGHQQFCEYLAGQGWVAVTMSYHLTMREQSFGCDQPAQNKINTFRVASQNIHTAVNYIIERKNKFKLDESKIVLAGSSAGAEAVLHAAYWQETSEDILPAAFQYAGVISMAGALLDKSWINDATAIPSQFFHGTCDPLVPYGTAPHHYCQPDNAGYMMLDGALPLSKQLQALDKQYYLVTGCNDGHEWAGLPMHQYRDLIWDFLSKDVLEGAHRQTRLKLNSSDEDCHHDYAKCKD